MIRNHRVRSGLNAIVLPIALAAVAGLSAPALGQTAWYVDGSCTFSGTGTTDDCAAFAGAAGAFTTISQAFTNPGLTNGDTIHVAPGTYTEQIDFANKRIRVVAVSDNPTDTIIESPGGTVVTIGSGQGNETVLRGFKITGAETSGTGGGIYLNGTSPQIINCRVTDNFAGSGGGIYSNGGDPRITNCSITDNNCAPGDGGGIYCNGGAPVFTNTVITGNQAGRVDEVNPPVSSSDGGGVYLAGTSAATLTGCDINFNVAFRSAVDTNGGYGGGIYMESDCNAVLVSDCDFLLNFANVGGGGIYLDGCSPMINDGTRFHTNVALAGPGGGIWNEAGSPTLDGVTFARDLSLPHIETEGSGMFTVGGAPTLTDCTFESLFYCLSSDGSDVTITGSSFTGARSQAWVGIESTNMSTLTITDTTFTQFEDEAIFSDGGTLTVVSCEFSDNDVGISAIGGDVTVANSLLVAHTGVIGAAVQADSGSLSVTNCTVVSNRYGLWNTGVITPSVENCILWYNQSAQIFDDGPDAASVVTYSDIQGGWVGTANIDSVPAFLNPACGDYRLKSGSTCVDAGNNMAADLVNLGIMTDLSGNPRITDGDGDDVAIVNMGAYESEFGTPCPCEMNCEFGVDVLDLLAFLNVWFTGDPASDYNGDGNSDSDVIDLLDFLACWFPAINGDPC